MHTEMATLFKEESRADKISYMNLYVILILITLNTLFALTKENPSKVD